MKKRKKIKILSILLSMAMVMSMLVIQNPVTVSAVENEPDSVVNLVLNPDFDNGLTSWVNYVAPSNAAAEFKVVNDQNMSGVNALNAVITNGGSNTGHIQLKQKSLKLESGETYILSFLAKADSSKNVPINIKATTSPYTIFLSQTINLNNELKTFEYTMEIPGDKGQLINTDLIFNFGGSANSGSNIYLDKFILAKVVPGVFPKTNTYYVDSVAGDDANDGLSEETAWSSLSKVNVTTFKAGDKILLKAGAVWTGTLFPQGSGTKGNPIIIDMYGEGNKPIINGNGKAYTKEDIVDAAVYLRNQDYWTIENLEVTNASPTPDVRSGIHVDATSGNHAGITIENCYVHDVASDGNRSSHGSIAAISVLSRTFSASFSNVLINNNVVERTGSTGIYSRGGSEVGLADNHKITNNSLIDIGGDGILITNATAPLVEHNVVNGWHTRSSLYCCGIWPFGCDDAVIQFNEVYGGVTTMDGQGFDADYECSRTIIQYNYSHDNEGGFLLVCAEADYMGHDTHNDGAVIRYNISENDQSQVISLGGHITNISIYNNTIYVPEGLYANVVNAGPIGGVIPENVTLTNNIFYNLGSGGYGDFAKNSKNTVFNNNLFYGNHPVSEPVDANQKTYDPMIAYPGRGDNGIESAYVYQLLEGSPAIADGAHIANNGGKDFWGNLVSDSTNPNIGAYNGIGVKLSDLPVPPELPEPVVVPTEPPTTVGTSDEFNSEDLGSSWYFVRPSNEHWSLSRNTGFMSIDASSSDVSGTKNNGQNIILQNAPEGDWRIITKMDGKPAAKWLQSGLIVYQDDDNFFKMVRLFDGSNKFQFAMEVGGTFTSGLNLDLIDRTVSYLSVEKKGNTFTGYYSEDGESFVKVWDTKTSNFTNVKIGLINLAGIGYTADFDYFRYDDVTKPLTIIDQPLPPGYEPEPENYALNKHVEVDSIYAENFPASKAVDGNIGPDNATRWLSIDSSAPHWIYVDLESPKLINNVRHWVGAFGYGYALNNYRIQISNDAQTWRDVVVKNNNTNATPDDYFDAVTTRYVRLFNESGMIRLYELKVQYVQNPPPTTILTAEGTLVNNWFNTDANITLTAKDNGTVVKTEYLVGDITSTEFSTYTGPFTITEEGTYVVKFRSTDETGKVEGTKAKTVKIDKTASVSHAILTGTKLNETTYNSDVEVSITASDTKGASGVRIIEYSLDGESWTVYSGAFKVSNNGTTTVSFKSTDMAGNVETAQSISVNIDKDETAPVTSHSVEGTLNNGWYTSNVAVTLSAADDKEVSKTEYRIGESGDFVTYIAPISITAEGVTKLQYRSTDAAGNVEETKSVTIYKDKNAPVSVAVLTGTKLNETTFSSDIEVSITAVDTGSGVLKIEYSLDSTSWQEYIAPIIITNSGSTTVSFRSKDIAGNVETAQSISINIILKLVDKAAVVDIIENAPAGTTIVVDANTNKHVYKEIFDAIKGQDKTVIFEYDGVSWSFNGKDIHGDTKDIELKVAVKSILDFTRSSKEGILGKVREVDTLVISFEQNGKLPGKATVRINQDSNWLIGKDKNNICIYYYNEKTQQMENIAKGLKVNTEGYVQFEITHNSD